MHQALNEEVVDQPEAAELFERPPQRNRYILLDMDVDDGGIRRG